MGLKNDYVRGSIAIATVLAFYGMTKAGVSPATLTVLLLIVTFVYFLTEALPIAFTALLVPVVLSITGILNAKTAFSYFGDEWVLMFLFMFMVGGGIFRTGAAKKIGEAIVKAAGASETRLMLLVMVATAILSAFLSNTATTAAFLPIVVAAAYAAGINPKRLLLPLAFAASVGGMMTLIGTPPNGIVNSVLDNMGMKTFGFFEFAKIGLPTTIVSIVFMVTVGKKLIPSAGAEYKGTEVVQIKEKELRTDKMWLSVAIFVLTMLLMFLKVLPYHAVAALGAVLMVTFGCITPREAYNSVSWTTIFLFAGMLPMSKALETSGAAEIIGNAVVTHVSNPYALLFAVMLVTFVLTNAMSNTATTAILAPLVIDIAKSAHLSPYPFLMALAMSASLSLWTPVATPPNTIVFGPGEYTFWDYIKVGLPLGIVLFIVVYVLTLLFYPITL